jgi:hypothetical protein
MAALVGENAKARHTVPGELEYASWKESGHSDEMSGAVHPQQYGQVR